MVAERRIYNLRFRSYPILVTDRVRVSIGSASVLGLVRYRLAVPPTTAYIMSYHDGSCSANCSFCAQASGHQANHDQLSRVVWPDFPIADVIKGFKAPAMDVLERICFQVINYPDFLKETIEMVNLLRTETDLPISVDICPVGAEGLQKLKEAGAERISIPLDGATEEIFDNVKGKNVGGPYRWEKHLETLQKAVELFGEGMVGTNLIIGLGETEKEAVEFMQKLMDIRVRSILFAFTPLKGTKLESLLQPDMSSYRRVQVARHLIVYGHASIDEVLFDDVGKITGFYVPNLVELLGDGEVFRTTGCPGCNRPFYNERPSGPFFNYPRPLTAVEIQKELQSLGL